MESTPRKNSTKIQIRKTERETEITLCSVKFNDINLWNVEQMNNMGSVVNDRASINNVEEEKLQKTKTGYDTTKNDTLDNYLSGSFRVKTNTFKNLEAKGRFSSYNLQSSRVTRDPNGALSFKIKNNAIYPRPKSGLRSSMATDSGNIELYSTIMSYREDSFAELMELDGIKPEDMMESLSLDKNRNMVFKAGEGAGQSGSFFFFSHDNKFLIKTLRGNEKQKMLEILDDYIDHIRKTKNKSLLARIYGIYTVKTDYFDPLDIIVMQNTAVLRNKKNDKLTFDLKGSYVGRKEHFSPDEKFWLKDLNCKKVLKDLNYLEINQDLNSSLMNIRGQQYDQLEWLLKLDSIFLKNH